MPRGTDETAGRHAQSAGVLVLVVLLSVAAVAVALLAMGRVGAMAVVGDPPRPGWTLAPGPWSGVGAPPGTPIEHEQAKEQA